MTNSERISTLIFRYIRNELSRKERAELENWRKDSPKNEETFQEAIDPEKIQADLKALEESRISRLGKDTMHYQLAKPAPRSIVRRILVPVFKFASILTITCIVIFAVLFFRLENAHSHPAQDSEDQLAAIIDISDLTGDVGFNRGVLSGIAGLELKEGPNGWLIAKVPDSTKRNKDLYYRLFTSEGNRMQLNFSDSTQIWLNSKATIKYPSWQRSDSIRIFLSGEAYVHIPSGTTHVYDIKISPPIDSTQPSAFKEAVADKTSRSIYLFSSGGDFYLKAYPNGSATTATLISGSARIDSVGGKAVTPVILVPGQRAKLDSGALQVLKPEHFGDAWRWKNF